MTYKFFFNLKERSDVGFWALPLLGTFLLLVFLTGGGSRADVQSLVILQPVSLLCLGVAVLGLQRTEFLQNRFLFILGAAVIVLTAAHLVMLPPELWHLLPGRFLAADVDEAVGLNSQWRPLSLVPDATWNSLFSLAVPAAVFLLAIKINDKRRVLLLLILLLLGLLSGLIGLVQTIGSPQSSLYFYRITNNGAAVGLFANRNHQAMFLSCLFPMLAVFASTGVNTAAQANRKLWLALGAGTLLIPLVLITGSRAGLVTSVIGILSVLTLYRRPIELAASRRTLDRVKFRTSYFVLGGVAFAISLFLSSRVSSVLQISMDNKVDELRFQMWGPIWNMVKIYMPWGSGIGSFVETYRVHEPQSLLSVTYRNHAHNDWLETILTGGLPALMILVAATVGVCRAAWINFKVGYRGQSDMAFARLGTIILLILAFGSFADYPLRTPSLAGLFVIAAVWAATDFGIASKDVMTLDIQT